MLKKTKVQSNDDWEKLAVSKREKVLVEIEQMKKEGDARLSKLNLEINYMIKEKEAVIRKYELECRKLDLEIKLLEVRLE